MFVFRKLFLTFVAICLFVYLVYSWLANTQTDDRISISHQVTNYEFFYEPFYVALDNAPPHDERFVGYGFTRNSQVGITKKLIRNRRRISQNFPLKK